MIKSFTSALPQKAFALMLGVSFFAIAGVASAQTAAPAPQAAPADDPTVVVVTANKRREPVQKVAQTVNVVSGQQLQDMQIRSFQEVATAVAGLSLTRTSGGEQSISLRGIKMPNNGGTGGATNTVEVYLNEVPISTTDAFNALFDIGQIEVLRGPQGTLRGRPSPSGAMTVATQRGSFTQSSGYIEGSVSDHNGKNVQAAYGGPISDKLAFRVAGLYDYNNDNEVKSLGNGKESYRETTGLRGSLTWRPVDHLEINLMQQYIKEDRDFYRSIQGTAPCAGDSGGAVLVSSVGCGNTYTLDDRTSLNTGPSPVTYRGNLTTLSARYDLGNYAINYVGGYNDATFANGLDFDFAGIGQANQVPTWLLATGNSKTFTNELRFESTNGEFYNFTYGAFSSDAKNKGDFAFIPFFTSNPSKSENKDYGVFTNQRFNLSARDKLSVGLRYSHFYIDRLGTGPNTTYQAITGNASYNHDFSRDVMGYVSYGTSFRPGSGGANTINNPVPVSNGNFDSEHSQSMEIGLKSQWFQRRLTANISLFDQKYDGYIASMFNVACTGVPNTAGMSYATNDGTAGGPTCFGTMYANGNAISRGVELELRYAITPDWTAGLNYTYTDAHFVDAVLPCNDYNGDGVPDVTGTPMVQQNSYISHCVSSQVLGQLPATSIAANTTYNFKIGGLDSYVRANAIFRDKAYFPQTANYMPGYTQVNAYVGIKGPNDSWELSLWAKNLFDEVVQDTDGGPWTVYGVQSGLSIGTVTNRRELGVTLRKDF
jgi:iron complex outermembrane receptor protein